jgi:hypothetical protein
MGITWQEALKIWNTGKTWSIPKRGTDAYREVKAIQTRAGQPRKRSMGSLDDNMSIKRKTKAHRIPGSVTLPQERQQQPQQQQRQRIAFLPSTFPAANQDSRQGFNPGSDQGPTFPFPPTSGPGFNPFGPPGGGGTDDGADVRRAAAYQPIDDDSAHVRSFMEPARRMEQIATTLPPNMGINLR